MDFFSSPSFYGHSIDKAFFRKVDRAGPILSFRVYFPAGPSTSAISWLNGKSTLYDYADSEAQTGKLKITPSGKKKHQDEGRKTMLFL